jgi:predicted RNase H-like HicB family nuclease
MTLVDAKADLTAVVTREGDWYVACCMEIEATSQGETVEQALDNLRDVVEVHLEEGPAPATPQPPWSPRSTCASRRNRPAFSRRLR